MCPFHHGDQVKTKQARILKFNLTNDWKCLYFWRIDLDKPDF